MQDLTLDVRTVITAAEEVLNAQKLPKVFEVMLALGKWQSSARGRPLMRLPGNYLNGGTKRGQAYGFTLSAIDKICCTKANNGMMLVTR